MSRLDTAKTLSFVGAILSLIFGVIYLLVGIASLAILSAWVGAYVFVWAPWLVLGIVEMIFGILTLIMARKKLMAGGEELKMGAIFCMVFGCITIPAIGGILTLVAGILAIIEYGEQKKTPEVPPPPPR
jgi:hypothetical protein